MLGAGIHRVRSPGESGGWRGLRDCGDGRGGSFGPEHRGVKTPSPWKVPCPGWE